MRYSFPEKMIRQTVETFKTNVHNPADARHIVAALTEMYPALHIYFDLEDTDHVLRVKGFDPDLQRIQRHLLLQGFDCEIIN